MCNVAVAGPADPSMVTGSKFAEKAQVVVMCKAVVRRSRCGLISGRGYATSLPASGNVESIRDVDAASVDVMMRADTALHVGQGRQRRTRFVQRLLKQNNPIQGKHDGQ